VFAHPSYPTTHFFILCTGLQALAAAAGGGRPRHLLCRPQRVPPPPADPAATRAHRAHQLTVLVGGQVENGMQQWRDLAAAALTAPGTSTPPLLRLRPSLCVSIADTPGFLGGVWEEHTALVSLLNHLGDKVHDITIHWSALASGTRPGGLLDPANTFLPAIRTLHLTPRADAALDPRVTALLSPVGLLTYVENVVITAVDCRGF
jgi:hypothetical protein